MDSAVASDTPKRRGIRAIDDETQGAIIKLARSGTPLSTIADLLSISRASMYRWMNHGQDDPDGPYGEFSRAMLKARAEHQLGLRGVIDDAAAEDPKWAAWLLERHFPRHYGKGAQLEVNVAAPAEQVQVIDVSNRSLAELEAELEENDGE